MRILYDVKKRRLIVRLVIVGLSLFALVMLLKNLNMPTFSNRSNASNSSKTQSTATPSEVNADNPLDTIKNGNSPKQSPDESGVNQDDKEQKDRNGKAIKAGIITSSPSQLTSPLASPTPSTESSPVTTPAEIKKTTVPNTPKVIQPTASIIITSPSPTASITPDSSKKLTLMYLNSNGSPLSNSINSMFKLVNNGTSAIKLSDVKIRYYYTIDREKPQNFWCDWCSADSSNVTGRFVKLPAAGTVADHYVEIGFTDGAGVLGPKKNIEVQTRLAKNDWSNYTQTNDYSFNSSASDYTKWNNVTLYVSGKLVFGKEP